MLHRHKIFKYASKYIMGQRKKNWGKCFELYNKESAIYQNLTMI